MITGLNATIGVFVLVFVFGGFLLLERYLDKRKTKKTVVPKEVTQVFKAVDVKLSPEEKWDAHVENLSK